MVVVFFLLTGLFLVKQCEGQDCPLDFNGKTYTNFTDTLTDKFSAQLQCWNEGYSLPTFAAKTEFDGWIAALKNAGITHKTNVWIGYTYTAVTADNGNKDTTGFSYDEFPNGGSAYNPFADYAAKQNKTVSEPWPADQLAGNSAGSCAYAEIWTTGNGQPRMRSAPCKRVKAVTVCECAAITTTPTTIQGDQVRVSCNDNSDFCDVWARRRLCIANFWVRQNCPRSCAVPGCESTQSFPQQPAEWQNSCRAGLTVPSQRNFVSGSSKFAWNIYLAARRDSGPHQNIFFSPASITLALGMVLAGARESTRQEIVSALLGYSVPDRQINAAVAWLMNELNKTPKQYELCTANAIYVQNDWRIMDNFMQTVTNCFNSSVQSKDFVMQSEPTRREINQWVEAQTNNKIRDLLGQGTINPSTVMVLINAIYFKGDWLRQFTQTFDGLFYPRAGADYSTGKTVKMMSLKNRFLFSDQDPDFKVLGIPYKGEELRMFIFLPKTKTLEISELRLSAQKLQSLMDQAVDTDPVKVTIPKFKMTQDLPLKQILQGLGIVEMFEDIADLSGITGSKDLQASEALHKAFIEVNERGTEAAAATAFILIFRSSFETPPPTFTADHPFVFLIRHEATNAILFLGSLSDVESLE